MKGRRGGREEGQWNEGDEGREGQDDDQEQDWFGQEQRKLSKEALLNGNNNGISQLNRKLILFLMMFD